MTPLLYAIATVFVLFIALFLWIVSRYESAEPNQWLIHIRKGKPIQAGIGIRLWRRPGDAIARFTSTMQRVTFETEVYTLDKQSILVKGFILWVVSSQKEAPFKAFSKLGIAHQETRRGTDLAGHHALSRPQHHAFRRSVEAVIRKSAVLFPLQDLLSSPGLLGEKVELGLKETLDAWGICLESVELNEISVNQEELFAHLQAPYIQQSRKEAEKKPKKSNCHPKRNWRNFASIKPLNKLESRPKPIAKKSLIFRA